MNNGRLLGGPQPAKMVIAAPMNDLQLVCLVAAQLRGDTASRVALAMDLVAEAVVKVDNGQALARLIQTKRDAAHGDNPI